MIRMSGCVRSFNGGDLVLILTLWLALCLQCTMGKDILDMEFCGDEDCYVILNVTTDSTRGEVRRGYHKMSLLYHPDKQGEKSDQEKEVATELFRKVARAYEVLSNETIRQSYDLWVRGGRKRRPQDHDFDGPMPAYYRDDTLRDVQDTPAAIGGIFVTLILSIGLPACLTLQGRSKKRRGDRGIVAKLLSAFDSGQKQGAEVQNTANRKERRGEKERTPKNDTSPEMAEITAFNTTLRDREPLCNDESAGRENNASITKVSGPWTPEEEAELIRATAKYPGGAIDRWTRVADMVGTRTAEDCIKKASELKGRPFNSSQESSDDVAKAKTLNIAGKSDNRKVAAGSSSSLEGKDDESGSKNAKNPLAKVPIAEFAKMVKEHKRVIDTEKASETSRAWTASEQALLENAMRLVDKNAADRWDQIAERVPSRSRKEVLARVKEVRELLKSKSAAADDSAGNG